MKHSHLRLATALLFASVILLHSGCKEDSIIRAKAAPNSAGIEVVAIPDTLSIISKTVYIDTYNTAQNPLYIQALGSITDPLFGKTSAGIAVQVEPPAIGFTFSADPYTLDSAFVILPLVPNGVRWGDTLTTTPQLQAVTVYQMDEDLNVDSGYYSNRKPVFKSTAISKPYQYNVTQFNSSDSISVFGINRQPHLRIPLTSTFISDFNNGIINTANVTTTAAFLSFFKGIYIAPDTNNPASILPYFTLVGANDYSRTSIVFYYHTTTNGDVQSSFFNFVAADCAHYNYITKNDPLIRNAVKNSQLSPNVSDDIVYIEGRPGPEIDIRIPYIKNLPIGVINKAQLTFTQLSVSSPQYKTNYFVPSRIDPYHVASDGTISFVADWQISGPTTTTTSSDAVYFTDGRPFSFQIGGSLTISTYSINIPREVQKAIIEKWDELHLLLRIPEGYPAAYQLITGGRNNTTSKMSLQIYYSKPQ